MARLEVVLEGFNMKLIKEAYVAGYMACASEHNLTDSIESDLNILGIATLGDDPEEDE